MIEDSLAEIRIVLRLDPLNLKANDNLGQQYMMIGRYDQALEQFKKVVELDPGFASVHTDLANVYFATGKHDLWLQENEHRATLSLINPSTEQFFTKLERSLPVLGCRRHCTNGRPKKRH